MKIAFLSLLTLSTAFMSSMAQAQAQVATSAEKLFFAKAAIERLLPEQELVKKEKLNLALILRTLDFTPTEIWGGFSINIRKNLSTMITNKTAEMEELRFQAQDATGARWEGVTYITAVDSEKCAVDCRWITSMDNTTEIISVIRGTRVYLRLGGALGSSSNLQLKPVTVSTN